MELQILVGKFSQRERDDKSIWVRKEKNRIQINQSEMKGNVFSWRIEHKRGDLCQFDVFQDKYPKQPGRAKRKQREFAA